MRGFQGLRLRSKLMVVMTAISALVLISAVFVFAVHDALAFRSGIVESTETTGDSTGTRAKCSPNLEPADSGRSMSYRN